MRAEEMREDEEDNARNLYFMMLFIWHRLLFISRKGKKKSFGKIYGERMIAESWECQALKHLIVSNLSVVLILIHHTNNVGLSRLYEEERSWKSFRGTFECKNKLNTSLRLQMFENIGNPIFDVYGLPERRLLWSQGDQQH